MGCVIFWNYRGRASIVPTGNHRIRIFAGARDLFEGGIVDVPHAPGDFFDAADLQSLPLFDDLDVLRCLHERMVRAGVKPRHAAVHFRHEELARFEVGLVHVGDFVFPAHSARGLLQSRQRRCRRNKGPVQRNWKAG